MKLESFHTFVVPFVLDLPIPTVEQQIREAAHEFFKRTRAWQLDLDPMTAVAGEDDVASYDLDLPKGAEATRLIAVKCRGADYVKRSEIISPASMRIQSGPGAGETFTVRVALAPSVGSLLTSWEIPDALDPYRQDIAAGALYRLLAPIDGKAADAERNRQTFESRISKVGMKTSLAFSTSKSDRPERTLF